VQALSAPASSTTLDLAFIPLTGLWATLILCSLIPAAAQATSSPAQPSLCRQLAEQELTEKNLPQWQAAVLSCQNQGPWLARLGHQLNKMGLYREAAEHLERALLIDSPAIDVQIDYAIALAGLGDKASAQGLVEDLLQNPQLPPAVRAALAQQHHRLGQADTGPTQDSPWQTQAQVGITVGHDSNLLGAPDISSLALTVGGITQTLPLENNYMAQPGSYHRTEALVHARHQANNQPQWDLIASLRYKASPGLLPAQSQQYELIAERSTLGQEDDPSAIGVYLRIHLAGLQARQSGLFTLRGLALGLGQNSQLGQAHTRCQWRAGAELQTRHYQNAPILSGQYTGLSLQAVCQKPLRAWQQLHPTQWQMSLRTGQDQPQDPARAGATQTQTALHAQWQTPAALFWPGAAGQWRFSGEWAVSQDSQPYSPLLQSGAVRRIQKKAIKLEYQRELGKTTPQGHWLGLAGLEAVTHSANIRLFGLRSWGPYVSMRFTW
jgi:hypothetical protein